MAYEPLIDERSRVARQFALEDVAPEATAREARAAFPHALLQRAFELGLMQIEVPSLFGGAGGTTESHCGVLEEVASVCLSTHGSMLTGMLGAWPVLIAGSDAQKEKLLRQVTQQLTLVSLAVSEPDAGSDVGAINTRYEKTENGYRLNGTKRWISNGSHADWYLVLATSNPKRKAFGLTFFMVPRDAGVQTGPPVKKMGQRATDNVDVIFDDVEIPADYRVGREGAGFLIAQKAFRHSRPYIAAGGSGAMRRVLDIVAATHSDAHRSWLAQNDSVYRAAHRLWRRAAQDLERDGADDHLSPVAKVFGADEAVRMATEAMTRLAPNPPDELVRIWRDVRVLQIVEGTSQILRLEMAKNALTGASR